VDQSSKGRHIVAFSADNRFTVVSALLGFFTFSVVAVSACNPVTPSVRDQAQQIVDEREHVAAVETMTGLLEQSQAAEAQGTAVAVAGQVTGTAVAVGAQQTATAASVGVQQTATAASFSVAKTATASAAELDVQETQVPIIAQATVAAAREAAAAQATAIVDAQRQQAVQQVGATATAQADAAQARAFAEASHAAATATAQRSAATATALAQAVVADAVAWRARRDAAAHYVQSCEGADAAASQTTTISDAIHAALNGPWSTDTGAKPVGSCPDSAPG
jgi:hypothetical protein